MKCLIEYFIAFNSPEMVYGQMGIWITLCAQMLAFVQPIFAAESRQNAQV
jgi:hypothetical protein